MYMDMGGVCVCVYVSVSVCVGSSTVVLQYPKARVRSMLMCCCLSGFCRSMASMFTMRNLTVQEAPSM